MTSTKREKQKKYNHPVLVIGEIGLVSSLGELNMPLYVGFENNKNIARYSRFAMESFKFSDYDTSTFIQELCDLGKRFEYKPVLFSDDDRALLTISQNRDKLADYYLFSYPENNMVENILDKQSFAKLSNRYDLPAPESYRISSFKEFSKVASEIKYPCIIKPTQRHYWWGEEFVRKVGFYRKAIKCSDYRTFRDTYRKISGVNPSVVVQEYVEGADKQHYSANLFVSDDGELQGYYIAQKMRIYPIKAGSGTFVQTVDNEEVLDISMDIINKLNLKGLINVQFKQDSRTGKYKLMEIHIRNSMWSLLGKQAGANLPYYYYRHLVDGSKVEKPVKAKPRVKYFDLTKDILALRSYLSEGEMSYGEWWKSLKGDRVFVMFSQRDPKPLLYLLWYSISSKIDIKISLNKRQKRRWNLGFFTRYLNSLTKIF